MSGEPIHFLAGRYTLLERPSHVRVPLTAVWLDLFGTQPAFGSAGDCVRGVHIPLPGRSTRAMFVFSPSQPYAVRRAAWLVGAKWALEGVRVSRGSGPPTRRDWLADLEEGDADEALVEIWPEASENFIRDSVVLELASRPGSYVHRLREDPRSLWCPPAAMVTDALVLPSPEAAHVWIDRSSGEDGDLIPRWRAAALAQEEQRGSLA